MNANGTLYLRKIRPIARTDDSGEFRLELALVDNLGRNPHTGREEKEAYRVLWAGPEAQAFWQAHQTDLTTGTPLRVELQRLRAGGTNTYPALPELQARAKTIEMMPKRTTDKREQLSNQEQADSVSA